MKAKKIRQTQIVLRLSYSGGSYLSHLRRDMDKENPSCKDRNRRRLIMNGQFALQQNRQSCLYGKDMYSI